MNDRHIERSSHRVEVYLLEGEEESSLPSSQISVVLPYRYNLEDYGCGCRTKKLEQQSDEQGRRMEKRLSE